MATQYEYLGRQGGTWQGSDNTYPGIDNDAVNDLYGEVTGNSLDSAQGGNDTLDGGDDSTNCLYGASRRCWRPRSDPLAALPGDERGWSGSIVTERD